jgi:hypothetical protein
MISKITKATGMAIKKRATIRIISSSSGPGVKKVKMLLAIVSPFRRGAFVR